MFWLQPQLSAGDLHFQSGVYITMGERQLLRPLVSEHPHLLPTLTVTFLRHSHIEFTSHLPHYNL